MALVILLIVRVVVAFARIKRENRLLREEREQLRRAQQEQEHERLAQRAAHRAGKHNWAMSRTPNGKKKRRNSRNDHPTGHGSPARTAAPGQRQTGLDRMKKLLEHLGNPEKELQCVHIAGTNGKGSLAAMTAAILTAAGYKTGLTISPYVVDFRERFQIDGQMIPPRTLASLTQKVLDAVEAIRLEGGERPVQFEAVTALALLWFAREKCDLVVLETGLAGATMPPTLCRTHWWRPSPASGTITRNSGGYTGQNRRRKSRYHQGWLRGCLLPGPAAGSHGPHPDRCG